MDEAVRDLVLAPFIEIADKGRAAIENATAAGSHDMAEAAKKLAREGDRALKRMEPLCKKHLDEFSSSFVDALKENGTVPPPPPPSPLPPPLEFALLDPWAAR